MQIGALTAFLTYLMQILMSVMMATFMLMMVPRAAVCAERISEVLDTDSSVVPPADPGHRGRRARRRSSCATSSFHYPGAERAGAAATSRFTRRARPDHRDHRQHRRRQDDAAHLIPRLFDATGGAVLVDGVDVRDLDPELLWSRIGLVPQKPYLFSGTVASNLRYGNPDATDDELWEALEIAQAADFVAAMPGGLDAPIAQGGTNVSGGQRQRLAIARALVRKPEIYLFDDSFSALDLATDARLRAALRAGSPRDAAVIIVGAAGVDDHRRRPDPRARGRRDRRRGTHDELLDDLPDLRRDRRVPAQPQRRRHERATGHDDRPDGRRRRAPRTGPPRPRRDRPGRRTAPVGGHGHAGREVDELRAVAERLLGRLRAGAAAAGRRRRPRPWSASCFSVLGPKILGRATDVIFAGRDRQAAAGRHHQGAGRSRPLRAAGNDTFADLLAADGRRSPAGHRLQPLGAGPAAGARRCTSVASLFCWLQGYLLNGVVQRTIYRLRAEVEDKLNRLPLQLLRPAAARRAAEPGHQRHRQHRPEPAADAEPAAHLAADGHRRAGDDVLDLAAAGADRAGHDPDLGAGHRSDRASARRSSSSRSGGHTGALNGQIEEAFTGHDAGQGLRPAARGRGELPRERTRSCTRPASARSSSPA